MQQAKENVIKKPYNKKHRTDGDYKLRFIYNHCLLSLK